jgi:hypothetical protein
MSQESANVGSTLSGVSGEATTAEPMAEEGEHLSSSYLAEMFGAGFAAGVLLGGIVGVAVAAALGAGATTAFLVAVGAGFVFAPLIGLLVAERKA